MRTGLLLVAAILLEVSATLALRAALDHAAWFALVGLGYAGAFTALTFVLRAGLPVGVAYGIWAACGVALTAVSATVLFGDPLTVTMGAGIALVIGGVLCVELGSRAAHRQDHDRQAEHRPDRDRQAEHRPDRDRQAVHRQDPA